MHKVWFWVFRGHGYEVTFTRYKIAPASAPPCPACGKPMERVEHDVVAWACRCTNWPTPARPGPHAACRHGDCSLMPPARGRDV